MAVESAMAADAEPLLNGDDEPLLPAVSLRPVAMSDQATAAASEPAGKILFQVLTSIAATFGGLMVGLSLGYSSTADPDLHNSTLHTTSSEESLIGSMMPLGAVFGGLAAGWAMDTMGRRTTMVAITVPAMVGWLMIMYAGNVGVIIAGRVVNGFSTGCTTVVVPTYVSEVCEPRIRGSMGAAFQFQVTLGILLSYVIGKYASWNYLAMASSCFPVAWLVMVSVVRESPLWLVGKNRELEAHDALLWLRGPAADINSELARLRSQNQEMRDKRASFRDLALRQNLRPLVMSLMLMVGQQLCGINAVMFYTTNIFSDAGSSINANLSTIIIGVVQCLSTFAGVVLVDRLGRKILLICSDGIMCICLLVLGVYFYLNKTLGNDVSSIGWLPLVSLMVYIFAFSIGFGPIPWLMMGELFAPEVKGVASGIAATFNWSLAFIVTLTFSPLTAAITEAGAFWLFTAICGLMTAYVFFFVFETKGKTLQEIQDHFRQ